MAVIIPARMKLSTLELVPLTKVTINEGHISLRRLPNWEQGLCEYVSGIDILARKRPLPLSWGVHDCITYTAGALEAMSGVDLLKLAGDYGFTRESASRRFKKLGLTGVQHLVSKLFPEGSIHTAQKGWIATVPTNVNKPRRDPHVALGIVDSPFVYTTGINGPIRWSLFSAVKVFNPFDPNVPALLPPRRF